MKKDLTKGSSFKLLWTLALPIMGTSIVNMTYNLADMFWLGKLGSREVAAVGTSSFYIHLGFALLALSFVGGGILVAHRLGEGKEEEARLSGENAIYLASILSLIYILFLYITKEYLIGFFNLDTYVFDNAIKYLNITVWSVFLTSNTMAISRILNSYGNSKVPFYISTIGLLLNIILDPILIFYFNLGIRGAGFATILSKSFILIILIVYLCKKYNYFKSGINIQVEKFKSLIKLGFPVTIQRSLFTLVSIVLGRIVATWGADAISGQRIAVQIESISFMTAGGFQGALASFVGQNYGAKKLDRIKKGYFEGLSIILSSATIFTLVFIFFGEDLVSLFIKDKEVVKIGGNYLRIIGYSQVFMALEMTTVGGFQGMGKTFPPAFTSIVFTLIRIPLALYLTGIFMLDGVWISIGFSSFLKGIILGIWFLVVMKKLLGQKDNH